MICYLHIGTEKTGTTTIQHFLSQYRAEMQSRGVLFPASAGPETQTKLAAYAMEDHKRTDLQAAHGIVTNEDVWQFRLNFLREFGAEVRGASVERCILSSEHCSSRLLVPGEIERLRDLLLPHFDKIYVVVYLRRQDDFLLSSYSTAVKFGRSEPCTLPPPAESKERYNYDALLARWKELFGRDAMIVRRYQRKFLTNKDILDDFLGIVAPDVAEGLHRPVDSNVSLDAASLEWLRNFNKFEPFLIDGKVNPNRGNVVALLEQISNGPLFTMDGARLDEFMENFRESNQRVVDKYFNGETQPEGDPLFGPASRGSERVPLPEISAEHQMKITAALWSRQQQQMLVLRQQIAGKRA